jgi:hypothetical protein
VISFCNPQEDVMGVLYRLDKSGHGEIAKWGDDAESRAAGAKAFADLAAKGFSLFDVTNPLEGKKLDSFDPKAAEIIAVPRMVAG